MMKDGLVQGQDLRASGLTGDVLPEPGRGGAVVQVGAEVDGPVHVPDHDRVVTVFNHARHDGRAQHRLRRQVVLLEEPGSLRSG